MAETFFTVQSHQSTRPLNAPDTLRLAQMDTTDIDKFLGLPSALTIFSYDLVFSSKHEIFQAPISNGTGPRTLPMQLLWFIKRGVKGDKIIFSNIYVMKGDKKLRLADKTFIIP
ncbi:MAG: hypothetical protein JWO06_2935 [Bacteroidota bacterium]|nr:hypothetical protein [Bacteroidota bacterium]